MKKLFVPVDFGKEAAHAADYACRLAQTIGAEVCLYHAYVFPFTPIDVPIGDAGDRQKPNPYVSKDLIDHLNEQMEALSQVFRDEFSELKLSTVMDEAFPEYGIAQKAEELHSDLIVMTPRQLPRFLKWITGSVSESVATKSQLPVLIVPKDYRFESPNQLLYASNFDRVDGEKINAFLNLFEDRPARLFVSFIFEDDGRDYPASEFKILRDVLEEHIRGSIPNADMKFLVSGEESIYEGLEEQVEDYGIDMLAMTTHQRGFFDKIVQPSKTRKMIYETEIPLLIFHAEVSKEGLSQSSM